MSTSTLADTLAVAADGQYSEQGGVLDVDGVHHTWSGIRDVVSTYAHSLIDHGVRPGDRVLVAHPKSLRSFVSMHAVLAAGAVAVPIDPYGVQRSALSIAEQCSPSAIVGDARSLDSLFSPLLENFAGTIFATDPQDLVARPRQVVDIADVIQPGVQMLSLPEIHPDDLAYIFFTSGSTGEPKGMAHSHRGGLTYATEAVWRHRLDASTRLAATSGLNFDMSCLELYSTPLAGATAICVAEMDQRFPATLSRRIEDTEATHLYAVPFLFRQLQSRGDLDNRDLSCVTNIAYGGEAYAPAALRDLMAAMPNALLLNCYGPAELNAVTSYELPGPPRGEEPIPIGEPWHSVDLRVVDQNGFEVAKGTAGELVISGESCMAGYWIDGQIDDAILRSPRASHLPAERRWYFSGDVVRETEDDLYEFVGRSDHQVKLRGIRIELEEVEAVLGEAPGVEHCVVGAVKDPEGTHLVASIAVLAGGEFDKRTLRQWCSKRLPAAAVPTIFFELTELPTTATGKLDRRKIRDDLVQLSTTTGNPSPAKKRKHRNAH